MKTQYLWKIKIIRDQMFLIPRFFTLSLLSFLQLPLILTPSNRKKKRKTGKKNSNQGNCYLLEVLIKYLAEPENFIMESFNYFLNSFHPDFLTVSNNYMTSGCLNLLKLFSTLSRYTTKVLNFYPSYESNFSVSVSF